MKTKCSLPNCCLQSNFTFHSPRSRTHLELWKKILNIKEDNFYVCDYHFEEKYMRVEKRLTVDAYPTQFISSFEPGSQEFCQCCLKSFVKSRFLSQNETKYPIDGIFKEEVKDIIGIEIDNGVACSKCYEYIKQFKKFRGGLREKQEKRAEILKNINKTNFKSFPVKIVLPTKQQVIEDFDPNIKIKEEPKDEDEVLESVIDVHQENFADSMFQIKEEVFDEESVVKEESIGDNSLITSVKTEPEETSKQLFTKPPVVVKKILPYQGQNIVIKKPGGIIVKQVNLKNLKIVQPLPSQKFQVINQNVMGKIQQTTIQRVPNNLQRIIRVPPKPKPNTKTIPYKCQYCPNRFSERRLVMEHIKEKHTFKCHMCPSSYPIKINLIKHQISLHAAPVSMAITRNSSAFKFTCPICASHFSCQDNLTTHMANRHANLGIKKEEDNKFGNENLAGASNSSATTSTFQFNQTTINPVNNLVRKILMPANIAPVEPEVITEDPDGIPCLDCGLLLKPDKLLKHRMDAHSLNTHHLYYMCDLCGIEIKGKTHLINHMTIKHLAKNFVKCEFCDGLFGNQTEVICHKNLQHNFNGTRYTCHFCNRIFNNKRDMILHRKQHYSEKESRERLARIFCKKFKSYEPKSKEYK